MFSTLSIESYSAIKSELEFKMNILKAILTNSDSYNTQNDSRNNFNPSHEKFWLKPVCVVRRPVDGKKCVKHLTT